MRELKKKKYSTFSKMEMDQSFFDCIDHFNDPLATIPPLCYSDQMADAIVPLPESFDDHLYYNDGLSEIFSTSSLVPSVPRNYELDDFDHLDDIIDVVPLNTAINDPMISTNSWEDNKNFGSDNIGYKEKTVIIERERIKANGNSKLGDMGMDELKSYFYLPIKKAAKEMNVGLTLLKKRCRELGIPRWPHRKMKSLKTLIHNVQELGKESNEECARRELESLEEHRRLMEENPVVELTERTKKLRQACFKANYKRRLVLLPYFDPRTTSSY